MKHIVTIGGGTGTYTLLSGLRRFPLDITAIVSMADDGGSSGILRDELGVLPPGDIRQALVALSHQSGVLRKLFSYRFNEGNLKGHQFGNLFLSALEKITGDFDRAVIEASKVLSITGKVVPVTTKSTQLIGKTKHGKKIVGQHTIDEFIWGNSDSIASLRLSPVATINDRARTAIQKADAIIIGPGSLFTSLVPNFLVKGMVKELSKTKAKIIYITNLMTEKGQTQKFCVDDYVKILESYITPRKIDIVLVNNKQPSSYVLKKYRQEMERTPVRLLESKKHSYTILEKDLLNNHPPRLSSSDKLAKTRSLIRHDSLKTAQLIFDILT